jgi:membrane protein implicated in regulation of membrane protease activity
LERRVVQQQQQKKNLLLLLLILLQTLCLFDSLIPISFLLFFLGLVFCPITSFRVSAAGVAVESFFFFFVLSSLFFLSFFLSALGTMKSSPSPSPGVTEEEEETHGTRGGGLEKKKIVIPPAPIEKPFSLWPGTYRSPVTEALWHARSSFVQRVQNSPLDGPAQSRLLNRTPAQSRTSVSYGFSSDLVLREHYRDPWNSIRIGKLLEDLDALAGTIAVKVRQQNPFLFLFFLSSRVTLFHSCEEAYSTNMPEASRSFLQQSMSEAFLCHTGRALKHKKDEALKQHPSNCISETSPICDFPKSLEPTHPC